MDLHDHRNIAKHQQLFHFQDDAPGMVFWHPRGLQLCRKLEDAARSELSSSGYQEVRTPQILSQPIWEASGHWQHFAEGMFKLQEDDARAIALRPVNCPGHVQIYAQRIRSYRELPLRLAEFGVVHRKEPSGALAGLFRLRQFTQDDGHIFCKEEQLGQELVAFAGSIRAFYTRFGFSEVFVGLSTRPAERVGDDASWERAERALGQAAREVGLNVLEQPGEGAFYGPKLEFKLRDRLGRIWQCGTLQLDFNMPERFDLLYTDSDGRRRRPVMLHRALYGSLERFLGVLLEHHAGKLPAWLAAEPVHVLPVGQAELGYASELVRALEARGIHVVLAGPSERLALRVASAREAGVPFVLVVGPREVATRRVSVSHAGAVQSFDLDAAIAHVCEAVHPNATI